MAEIEKERQKDSMRQRQREEGTEEDSVCGGKKDRQTERHARTHVERERTI